LQYSAAYIALQQSSLISKEQTMTTNFRIQNQEETVTNTVADIFNVAAIALTGFLGLLTVAATI
jgi:hypothetical protein